MSKFNIPNNPETEKKRKSSTKIIIPNKDLKEVLLEKVPYFKKFLLPSRGR